MAGALALALVGRVTPAAADDDGYGEQTMAVDASVIALAGVGLAEQRDPLAVAALVGYAVGAPLVHLAHGELETSGLSLLTRFGAPLAGGVVGYILGGGDRIGGVVGVGLGLAVGAVVAMVTDAAVYASRSADGARPMMLSIGGSFGGR